jgi:hypothetical protein
MTYFPGMPTAVDLSTPENQYASEAKAWLTAYGQTMERAAQLQAIAYARGYLQNWPPDSPLAPEDLNAIIDMCNESLGEYSDANKTLVHRLRTDL